MSHHVERVLVAHASSGGSTKAVAEYLAGRLRAHGLAAEARDLADPPPLNGYDALVLGSAVHNAALLPVAEHFLRTNAHALRLMPVWLFSLGIGPTVRGPFGRALREMVPPKIADLCELVGPREYRAFAGVVPPGNTPLVSRALLWLCGGRFGDLRDWPAINGWSIEIARYLRGGVPSEHTMTEHRS